MLFLLITCIAHSDTLTKKPNNLYLATFNVYIFGALSDKYQGELDWTSAPTGPVPLRIKHLANVIAVGGFDLIALQEVKSGPSGYWAVKDLVKELHDVHGMNYRFFLSDPIGPGFRIEEVMAFLYRPHKAHYRRIDGQRSSLIALPGRDLVKTQWVANQFDFTLISAHLAWGKESDRNAGYEKVKDIFDHPAQYSADPDIVVVGDFNRFGKNFQSAKKLPYDASKFLAPNVTFFDPDFNSRKQVTKSSIEGKGIPGDNPQLLSTTVAKNRYVYDMILISRDVAEEFPAGTGQAEYGNEFGVIVYDEPDGFGFKPDTAGLAQTPLKEAYSDHRPLWMRFKTNAGNFDDTWP